MLPSPARLPSLLSAVLGASAIAAAMASFWPGLHFPAWPAGTLALAALAFACLRGPVLPKAVGTLSGALALLLVSLEVGALWAVAAAIP